MLLPKSKLVFELRKKFYNYKDNNMAMFEFNLYNVLNGLEDLSTQEKIKVLDEAYEEILSLD